GDLPGLPVAAPRRAPTARSASWAALFVEANGRLCASAAHRAGRRIPTNCLSSAQTGTRRSGSKRVTPVTGTSNPWTVPLTRGPYRRSTSCSLWASTSGRSSKATAGSSPGSRDFDRLAQLKERRYRLRLLWNQLAIGAGQLLLGPTQENPVAPIVCLAGGKLEERDGPAAVARVHHHSPCGYGDLAVPCPHRHALHWTNLHLV